MSCNPWQGKTAIVCGASSGLGRTLATDLAQQGVVRLVLLARDRSRLDDFAEQLGRDFPALQLTTFSADAGCLEAMQSVCDQLKQADIRLDLLVQAVGMSDRGELLSLTEPRLNELLRANVFANLVGLQALLPAIQAPGGTIVLIGSLASRLAPRYLGGYSIAKHALAALAGQARLELAERGIHVMLACPGPIARSDAGQRYAHLDSTGDVPERAQQPGGGAQIAGLEPQRLARDILQAAARKKTEIVRPRKVRLLLILAALSPKLGDWLLRRKTS